MNSKMNREKTIKNIEIYRYTRIGMNIVNILALFRPLALSLTSVASVPAKPTKVKPYGIFRYIHP